VACAAARRWSACNGRSGIRSDRHVRKVQLRARHDIGLRLLPASGVPYLPA
jgi:hypothetical protein